MIFLKIQRPIAFRLDRSPFARCQIQPLLPFPAPIKFLQLGHATLSCTYSWKHILISLKMVLSDLIYISKYLRLLPPPGSSRVLPEFSNLFLASSRLSEIAIKTQIRQTRPSFAIYPFMFKKLEIELLRIKMETRLLESYNRLGKLTCCGIHKIY